jgi:conjugal transfer mating pair stabilization protein TraG
LKLLLSIRHGVSGADPFLTANVSQFMIDCVNGSTTFNKADAAGAYGQAPDALAYIVANARPSGLTNYYDQASIPNGTSMACPDAGQKLLTDATNFYNSKKFTTLVNRNANEKNPNDPQGMFKLGDIEAAIQNIGQVGSAVSGSQQDARAYALNALFHNLTRDTFRCMDSTSSQQDFNTCTIALNQAFEKWKAESTANGTFFTRMMTPAIVFLQLMFFGFSPIVIIYSLFKGAGALPLYVKYLGFGIWTSSWLPFAAVIQMYIQSNVSDKLAAIQAGTGMLVPANIEAQFDIISTRLALASDLLAATPMVSLALLSGSIYSLSNLASKWNGQGHTDPSLVTPPVSSAAPVMASHASEVNRQGNMVKAENAANSSLTFNVANQAGIASADTARNSAMESISQQLQASLQDTNSSMRDIKAAYGTSQVDSIAHGYQTSNGIRLSTERGKGISVTKEQAQSLAQDTTSTAALTSSISSALAGQLTNTLGSKLKPAQAQKAVSDSIAALSAKDASFAGKLFGDNAAAREAAWGTVADGAYMAATVAAGILTAPEGGAGGIAMATARGAVGGAFAKQAGRAISSVVAGTKNVAGKLKGIDARELASLYSNDADTKATAAAQISLKNSDAYRSASSENQSEAVKVMKDWGMTETTSAQRQNATTRSTTLTDGRSHSDVDTASQIFGNALQKAFAVEQSYTSTVSAASGQTVARTMTPEAVMQELKANPETRAANDALVAQHYQQDLQGWNKALKQADSFMRGTRFSNKEDQEAVRETFALALMDRSYVMGATDSPNANRNAGLRKPAELDEAGVANRVAGVAQRTADAVPTAGVPRPGEVGAKVGHLQEVGAPTPPPAGAVAASFDKPNATNNRVDAALQANGQDKMEMDKLQRQAPTPVSEIAPGAKDMENKREMLQGAAIAVAAGNTAISAVSGKMNREAGLDPEGKPLGGFKGARPDDSQHPQPHAPQGGSPGRPPVLPKHKR